MSAVGSDIARLLAAQFDASPFAAVISRIDDGTIVYVNDSAARDIELEFGVSDPVGRSGLQLGYYESVEQREWVIERSDGPGGFLRRDDFRIGEQKKAELTSTHMVAVDGVDYLVTVFVDVSQVAQAEAELADALERLEKAQAISRTGDFVTDIDAGAFNGSAEAMRILGFAAEPATVSMRRLFAHFHADDKEIVAAAVNTGLADGAFAVEHRLDPSIDDERWVHTVATVETRADGRAFVRGTVHDITARKREELQRQRLNEKMQEAQKLESLGLLAGGIAHDFNNLLAGIMGNADFALLETGIAPEVRDRLQNIIAASRRAADLTRQLLAYSGKGRFVIETVDLSVMIRDMAELLTVSVSRGNSLRLLLAEDLPAVEVDTTQIRQVLMNLVINAAEASDHGTGVISVATGVQHCDEDYLRTSELTSEIDPGDYVYFEVSDDGAGMDADTLARIFDPFFTTKFTGRGLGLAAALGIARGHSGAIKISSEPGRGTSFKVFLPASPLAADPPDAEHAPHHDWRGSGTVLVIDDEESVRDFVKPVLERYGYDVLLARDGVEGLAKFRADVERVRLVLLDLTMPSLDGQATFTQLQAMRKDVPVVLMSGYNEQEATQRFVGKGLAGFISKPFVVSELMDMVREQLGPPAAQDSS